MSETTTQLNAVPVKWWDVPARQWVDFLKRREEQIFLVLTLVIGALVGLTVVAFIVLTEHVGARIYPPGGAAWHRTLAVAAGFSGAANLGELRRRGKRDGRPARVATPARGDPAATG